MAAAGAAAAGLAAAGVELLGALVEVAGAPGADGAHA